MISFNLRLSCLNDVGTFVKAADLLPCEITVKSGGLSVSGKSLMGILSLNLCEPITVEVTGEKETDAVAALKKSVSSYLV